MIPNNMALVPVNVYQSAAIRAIITVEDKVQRGRKLGQYPYARELFRELYGSSRKISAADVHRAAGKYDLQGRKNASKDDFIRALDTLLASRGEICPLPLSTDHGYLYFPEVRYRLRERRHRKYDLKVARRLGNEERERQKKRRRYQTQVAQAEIDLAFTTPSQLRSWYQRQTRKDIDDDHLICMVQAWSRRFRNLPRHLFYLGQPLWAMVGEMHRELENRTMIDQWLDPLALPNRLENMV